MLPLRFLGLFLSIVNCQLSIAQNDYLITNTGDSLSGRIAFYFTALDEEQKPIVPQQVHLKRNKTDQVLNTLEINQFEFEQQWAAATKPQRIQLHAADNFQNRQYFYEIMWRGGDSVQLVRTYLLGSPPRKKQAFFFHHRYYFITPSGTILQELYPDNAKTMFARYMPDEQAFLAALNKKKKTIIYAPHIGISKLCRLYL
jgi:hypothetical protein